MYKDNRGWIYMYRNIEGGYTCIRIERVDIYV